MQATIQSVHNRRTPGGATNWTMVAGLYDAVARLEPTVGVRVARAAAHLEADGASVALSLLDELPADQVTTYQPYWAVRLEALARRGADPTTLAATYAKALDPATDPSVRDHLRRRFGR